jgi:hypothetical protein
MARIRSIKPEFFRHEGLFDAEQATGLPLRLAFAGLWTAADREGRFKWQPRRLKLDCLPHDAVDFSSVLDALAQHKFVRCYEVDGEKYGYIPSWHEHQHINQREAQSTIPAPSCADTSTAHARTCNDEHPSTDQHVHAHGEGKGKEREGNGRERESARTRDGDLVPEDWTCTYGIGLTSLGFSHTQCLGEQPKFVAHYRANGETRSDWDACFVKWMLGARQRGDIAPAPSAAPVTAWLSKPGDPEWVVWKEHYRADTEQTGRRSYAFERMRQVEEQGSGSWTFPTRWPPGHEPDQGEQTRPAPVPQCSEIVPPEPKAPVDDGIPEILKRRKAG